MKSSLFIPKKIRVGFNQRTDTYTGKLAYVIYFDEKNVLRKETSWESWRDKKLGFVDFDNVPTRGFAIEKSIQRFNWSSFGSNRSLIRIYDPRDIEFEITTDNLVGVLTEYSCDSRVFDGEFVYAWNKTELVLLPCKSEEYKSAIEYTEKQSQTIGMKDLVVGRVYFAKKHDTNYTYLGRLTHYEWGERKREPFKDHVFAVKTEQNRDLYSRPGFEGKNYSYYFKKDAKFLAGEVSEEQDHEFADMMSEYSNQSKSKKIVNIKIVPGESINKYGMSFSINSDILALCQPSYSYASYSSRNNVFRVYDSINVKTMARASTGYDIYSKDMQPVTPYFEFEDGTKTKVEYFFTYI